MANLTQFNLVDNGFTATDLDVSGYVAAVVANQCVFVADGRPYNADINESGYHKIDFINTKITGTLTGTINIGDTVIQEETGATGILSEIYDETTYLIYRTGTKEFDATNEIKKDNLNYITPSAFKPPPHWLKWTPTEYPAESESLGFPDGGSNIMTLFEGRIWMNNVTSPNQWFATRQGDPLDLDTSQEDVQAAISSQSSEMGIVAEPLVALISYKDNYLLFGLANSIYILRGGSTGSGAISNLINESGVFSPDSWCWDNDGNLYFVGLTGFFKLPNGMATEGTSVDNISLRKLPNLFKLLKLNRKTDRVVLGFDRDNSIVNVSISMQDGLWATCFAYDTKNDAILPDRFPLGKSPSAFLYINNYQKDVSGLLLGCYDGYIRKFDSSVKDDDGETLESFTLFGPITLNQLIRANIKIKEIQIILSEDSDGAIWELYQGKSSEFIVKGLRDKTIVPTHTGVFTSGGRQATIYEKISGESIAILIRNNSSATPAESWGLEGIKIRFTVSGRYKDI